MSEGGRGSRMWSAIRQIVLAPGVEGSAVAGRLVRWARRHRVEVVREAGGEEAAERDVPDFAVARSKVVVRVVPHGGAALKPCTGRTASLLCCNLQVVTQTVGCPIDCSYCILQSYQNRGQIVVRADPAAVIAQLALELAAQPRRLHRVCTGQVGDSLALEPRVGFAREAVLAVASLDNAVLELKTKTDNVEFLLGLPHRGRTIISWSLNPRAVIEREERGAASLEARLSAAARVADDGYLLAFHLDPMVTRDGAAGPFVALVRQVLSAVPVDRLAYVSMGSVRFLPAMRRTVTSRFAGSQITQAELLPDVDGKLRLLPPARIALYRRVAREVRTLAPEAFIYLCMEPRRVWQRALGAGYARRPEVDHAMALSLHRRFALSPCDPALEDYDVEDG